MLIGKSSKKSKKKVNKKGSHSSKSSSIKSSNKDGREITSKSRNKKRLIENDSNIDFIDMEEELESGNNIRGANRNSRKNGNFKINNRKKALDEQENNRRRIKPGRTKEDVKRNFKRMFVLMLIIFIVLVIMYIVSLVKWYGIMKNAMRCENSIILDSTGNVIAVIGENRIQENVNINNVQDNLKNAYISIEDKNYKKHMGISVRRTGGAILAYVTHRGSSYGGSTITQQVIKNITGENETKITRKITEWDRAIKTEILFSKDDILQTYFNVIYVGPNIYGVKMGARYYFDKDVNDLSLAECAFMAGLTHSPNSYNPFNNLDNSDKIKNRTVTVLNVMLQEGYISQQDYDKAVIETNSGLNFKQGKVKAKRRWKLFIHGR